MVTVTQFLCVWLCFAWQMGKFRTWKGKTDEKGI